MSAKLKTRNLMHRRTYWTLSTRSLRRDDVTGTHLSGWIAAGWVEG